jgi:prepilin-type N-terminal cleavage/methylation domain-containing protein
MNHSQTIRHSRGFTVIELMIVMLILSLLVAMSLSAFSAAVNQARISRTKVIIAKLDQLVMDRWESYRTRPIPLRAAAGANVRTSALNRLNALRDIMRMELPHCQEDVNEIPTASVTRTAINRGYQRKLGSVTWSEQWEEAECLYLIIASMRDQEKSALDFFTSDEIGDIDDDGVPEIHDAWGQPIQFLRWAPGYRSDAANPALSPQELGIPDGFDLLKADARHNDTDSNTDPPFDLKPLIYSFGPDKATTGLQLSDGNTLLNDPYKKITGNYIGTILTPNEVADNITNHYQEAE